METYKNIDEFIKKIFPYEYQKIISRKDTDIQKAIYDADDEFNAKLEKILKGEEEAEEKTDLSTDSP